MLQLPTADILSLPSLTTSSSSLTSLSQPPSPCPSLSFEQLSLSLLGLQGLSSDHPEVLATVQSLASILPPSSHCFPQSSSPTPLPLSLTIANCYSGLSSLHSNHTQVQTLLDRLAPHLSSHVSLLSSSLQSRVSPPTTPSSPNSHIPPSPCISRPPSAEEVVMCMVGIQHMNSSVKEVQSLLVPLIQYISLSSESPSPEEVSLCLSSLKSIEINNFSLPLFHALSSFISRCSAPLSPDQFALALSGLRRKMIGHTESTSLLQNLLKLGVNFDREGSPVTSLSPALLSQGLSGLRFVQSPPSDLPSLTPILAPLISCCTQPFSGKEVGLSLSGLASFDSSRPGVPEAITALLPLIEGCEDSLTFEDISLSISGLRSKDFSLSPVSKLAFTLASLISRSQHTLQIQHLPLLLSGLKALNLDHPASSELLGSLLDRLPPSIAPGGLSNRSLAMSLSQISHMSSNDRHVRRLIGILAHQLATAPQPLNSMGATNLLFSCSRLSLDHKEVRQLFGAMFMN